MSVNLIQEAKNLFNHEVVNNVSEKLGESSSSISTALKGIVPAIFASLIHKTNTAGGEAEVSNMVQQAGNSGNSISDLLSRFTGGNNAEADGMSGSLFGNLLGGTGLSGIISNFAGIKNGSASSLIGLAMPAILGFIGKYISHNNVSSVSHLLQSQQEYVAAEMPAGLAIPGMTNTVAAASNVRAEVPHSTHHTETVVEEKDNGLKWILPLLLMVLLGAGGLYFFKGPANKNNAEIHESGLHTEATAHDSTGANVMAAGMVDSSGDYIYNVGNMKTITLPGNAGSITVGENSTEAKLVNFLQSSEAVDSVKGNWFEFTNVKFNTGKATIKDESVEQLKNMVMIAKAFPTAKFKIGGYTDNTGSEALNTELSKSRAAAVAAKIKALGAPDGSIVGSDGYGSQFPLADNATTEGRAQNRRVAVNVKAK